MTLSELRRRYRNGTSIEILAELAGCDRKDVIYALEQSGVALQKPDCNYTDVDAESHRIEALYDQGMNDREIAEALDLSQTTIAWWRKKNNRSSNFKSRSIIDIDKLIELDNLGVSVPEIAKQLGASIKTVYKWRQRARMR